MNTLVMREFPISKIDTSFYVGDPTTDETYQHILSSLKGSGFTKPLLIGSEYQIVDGMHRLCAAKELGYSTVPVVILTAEQVQIWYWSTLYCKRLKSHSGEVVKLLVNDLTSVGQLTGIGNGELEQQP